MGYRTLLVAGIHYINYRGHRRTHPEETVSEQDTVIGQDAIAECIVLKALHVVDDTAPRHRDGISTMSLQDKSGGMVMVRMRQRRRPVTMGNHIEIAVTDSAQDR